ncbi:mucin-1-like isoform X2 [Frankliniella occidentalis]|uniref:Mucin-1-like isoform X2 n=1 Tax=Frankliniella occidentalis TaxID=133901 RepID=A0A9C6WSC4_FRAOC|nr:mucin-1-like isoform X2 [Frankliniella occidentalis]
MAKPKLMEVHDEEGEGQASPDQASPSNADTTVQVENTEAVAAPHPEHPEQEDPPPAYCHVFPEGTIPASPVSTLNGLFGPHLTLTPGALPAVLSSARCSPPRSLSLSQPGPPTGRGQLSRPHSSVFVVAPSSAPVTPVSHYPGFAVASNSAPQTPESMSAPFTSTMTPMAYFPGFAVAQQSPTDCSSSSSLLSSTSEAQVFVVPSSLLSSFPHALFQAASAAPPAAQAPAPEAHPRAHPSPDEVGGSQEPEQCAPAGEDCGASDCTRSTDGESTREFDPSGARAGATGGDEPLAGAGDGGSAAPERRASTPSSEPEPYPSSAASTTYATAQARAARTPTPGHMQIYPVSKKIVRSYTMYSTLNTWQRRVLVISIVWGILIFVSGALGIYFIAFQPRI